MLDEIIEKTKIEFEFLKDAIREIHLGYLFGKYLANDIRQRTQLVINGAGDYFNNIAIVLQLGEYHLAWEDIQLKNGNPYSIGVVIHGLTHKKDDEMITDFWNFLKNNRNSPKLLPG